MNELDYTPTIPNYTHLFNVVKKLQLQAVTNLDEGPFPILFSALCLLRDPNF